jgi:VWFA-related protein
MKRCISLLMTFALMVPFGTRVLGGQRDDKIVLGTSEVILDVVVRDKKGRVVKDLKQSDFEVFEDTVRQDISSFRFVSRDATIGPGPKATGPAAVSPAAPAPGREPFSNISLIAMVFDHLSPNARGLAHKAAMSFIDESVQPDDLVTVDVIDNSLRVVQPYTSDRQLLRQAVDRATTMAVSTIESGSAQRRTLEDQSAGLENTISRNLAATSSAGPGNSGAAAGGAAAAAAMDQALAEMQIRMLNTFEMLERNQVGESQINSLLAVINSLHDTPGRKAVVLFSEGLALPPDVRVHFPAVVNAANRANVSIYTIDSAGLRVESGNVEAAKEIQAMGARRLNENASARVGREARASRPMTMGLERNEDLLKLNPQSGLAELANATGGFLIADTNDLSAGLRRVDEDLRAHYVLAYVPKNQTVDGKFRQIAVKLARAGLDIQTRKGYYALPPTGSSPVLDYEAPVLAAMAKPAQSAAFPLRSMAFNFPEPKPTGLTNVLAEIPASAFTFVPADDKTTYRTDFSIVAIIKDESHQVVSRLSQHYALTGPIDRLEDARRGDVLFYREDRLKPGHYVIETAAYDALSNKVSVRRDSIEVMPPDASQLRLSSVVIPKRAERLTPEEQKRSNPFHYGELLIYPNLGEPIRKAAMPQLPFLFTVYVADGVKSAPNLVVEVAQKNQRLARMPSELSAPDATGRIQFASSIPLESFQPGSYELRVTISDGHLTVTRSTPFTVAP